MATVSTVTAFSSAQLRRQSKPPIPIKERGVLEDARLNYKFSGSRDQAVRRAICLDASKHRADVSLSADIPGFVQEDLAVSDVGRRTSDAEIAGDRGRSDFGGESVLLLNVGAFALPAGCRIRLQ